MNARKSENASWTSQFRALPTLYQDIGPTQIAYRKLGQGEPLLLLHGWPFSGLTFRKILPALALNCSCYVPDIAGAGDTRWGKQTSFNFRAQAKSMMSFVEAIGLSSYSILAHDTGATLARLLAMIDSQRVQKLVLLNTEVPNHRPPWIPLYGRLFRVPFMTTALSLLLRSDTFLYSSMGFGGCFYNPALLDEDFRKCFIDPLMTSSKVRTGYGRFLSGFDWSVVDGFLEDHTRIKQPVLLIWGEDDPTFPLSLGRQMASQFANCQGFTVVPKAKLLVHEEQPDRVIKEAVSFLKAPARRTV